MIIVSEVELKALRLHAPADGLTERLAANPDRSGFHHLVGAEPVQVREGDLSHELSQGILGLVAKGLDVSQVGHEIAPTALVFGGELQTRFIFDMDLIPLATGRNAELSLEYLRNGLFEQLAALRHDVSEFVAGALVHWSSSGVGCALSALPQSRVEPFVTKDATCRRQSTN